MSPFEVRCYACDVSFPPGTRRCIHCGGPTAPPRDPVEAASPGWRSALPPPELEPAGEDESAVPPVPRLPIRILNAVLLVAVVAASFWRVCAEGGTRP